jgi:hypothetical protein
VISILSHFFPLSPEKKRAPTVVGLSKQGMAAFLRQGPVEKGFNNLSRHYYDVRSNVLTTAFFPHAGDKCANVCACCQQAIPIGDCLNAIQIGSDGDLKAYLCQFCYDMGCCLHPETLESIGGVGGGCGQMWCANFDDDDDDNDLFALIVEEQSCWPMKRGREEEEGCGDFEIEDPHWFTTE